MFPQIRSCLEACERIISYFKGDKHLYKRRSGYCVYARGKLKLIKQSPNAFTEVMCMIRTMYVAITRRGEAPRRWYDNTNFSPPPT